MPVFQNLVLKHYVYSVLSDDSLSCSHQYREKSKITIVKQINSIPVTGIIV